jgi:hypothetical protein
MFDIIFSFPWVVLHDFRVEFRQQFAADAFNKLRARNNVLAYGFLLISVIIWSNFGGGVHIFVLRPQMSNWYQKMRLFLRQSGKLTIFKWNFFPKYTEPLPWVESKIYINDNNPVFLYKKGSLEAVSLYFWFLFNSISSKFTISKNLV